MPDSVDRHLALWKGKAPYDEQVEAIVSRMQFLVKHLRATKEAALAQVGMQDFEFETLHRLAARGEPWRATPSELAAELMLSPAGMTGRLDTLAAAGLVTRVRSDDDRRRVDVELTPSGHERWLQAMQIRDDAERRIVEPLDAAERVVLDTLLARLLTAVERG
ncbi:MarR family winged helix-turn-helix transcriptional regulator [Pseudonocardia sp. TRM90224]|uniref:MarR family winged helix-turn-helix transcriptional regulator n=1 Tax=Pseudonocardia sp. TRM90224 TaxID=2812678 RepID=UPI001E2A531C|nr:MarR family winged helix-turn-helix transcriptional regulator [Pseudonocardia sp. TRM90224]